MFQLVLSLHNIWRWVVVLLIVVALVRMLMGWFGRKAWADSDRRILSFSAIALDIQLVLGLLLFFVLSPLTTSAFSNFGEAMRTSSTRFFLVEHTVMMLLAVIIAHVTSVLARRASVDTGKFRAGAIGTILVAIAVLAGMPWMRPLVPVF